jgi:hypothetical protein
MDLTSALIASQARELAMKKELEVAKIALAKAEARESLGKLREAQRRELEALGASQAVSAPAKQAVQKALKRTLEGIDDDSQATELDEDDPFSGGGGGGKRREEGGTVAKKPSHKKKESEEAVVVKKRSHKKKKAGEGGSGGGGGGGGGGGVKMEMAATEKSQKVRRPSPFTAEEDSSILRIYATYPSGGTPEERSAWSKTNHDLVKKEVPRWGMGSVRDRWRTLAGLW